MRSKEGDAQFGPVHWFIYESVHIMKVCKLPSVRWVTANASIYFSSGHDEQIWGNLHLTEKQEIDMFCTSS